MLTPIVAPSPQSPASAENGLSSAGRVAALHVNDDPCKQAIMEDIAASSLTLVISWSTSSRASANGYQAYEGYTGLGALAREYSGQPTVRALIDAKGASCAELPPQLSAWWQTGRLHCVHGPNRAAREAHTVLRFAEEMYDHLPAVVVFLQDDPDSAVLRSKGVGTAGFLEAMRARHVSRLAGARAEVPRRVRVRVRVWVRVNPSTNLNPNPNPNRGASPLAPSQPEDETVVQQQPGHRRALVSAEWALDASV